MKTKTFEQRVFHPLLAAVILLAAGSAFAQGERKELTPIRPALAAEGKAVAGDSATQGGEKSAAAGTSCTGRFQTGTTWLTPGIIVRLYTLANVFLPTREAKCTSLNMAYSLPLTSSQAVATEACNAGVQHNDYVRSISKAGLLATGGPDHLIGILKRGAAVYNCPQGGSINGPNCVISIPAVCPAGFSLSGSSCVKTYGGTIVTPAFCNF